MHTLNVTLSSVMPVMLSACLFLRYLFLCFTKILSPQIVYNEYDSNSNNTDSDNQCHKKAAAIEEAERMNSPSH